MGSVSVNRLGGACLALGPVLSIISFLLQPGGLFVEPVYASNVGGSITALASNPVLSNITAFGIALGLALTLYGWFVIQRVVRDGGPGDALTQLAVVILAIGSIGWILDSGLTFVMADTDLQNPQSVGVSVAVYAVGSALTLVSGLAIALGFLLLGLALSTRDEFNTIGAFLAAVVSAVALVSLVLGISSSSLLDNMLTVARVCYFGWVLWAVSLGVVLFRKA